MANSAFTHNPSITVPGSSTNTALVRWSSTGADTFLDSTIIVGATTMGLAADTDLLTFGSGTLAITGAITGVTTITATTFAGTLSGNATGSAATLTNARAIGGVNFDGSAAITLPGVNSAGDQNTSGTAAGLSTTLVVASGGTNTTSYTKGDVLIASAGTTLTKLGIGSNTHVLTADSNEATGVKWAAAGGAITSTSGGASNRIAGYTDADSLRGLANVTSDGTHLTLATSSKLIFGHTNNYIYSAGTTSMDVFVGNVKQIRILTGESPRDQVHIDIADLHMLAGNIKFSTAGRGIDFSATANSSGTMTSELLDWYEEGTFTPALIADSTSATAGASTEIGFYTRIGHRVFYTVILTVNSLSGVNTGQGARIKGLPFSSSTVSEYSEGSAVRVFSGMSLSTAGHGVYAGVGGSNSIINLFINNETTGAAAMPVSRFTASGHIEVSGSYIAV